jgi:hypothetical protein
MSTQDECKGGRGILSTLVNSRPSLQREDGFSLYINAMVAAVSIGHTAQSLPHIARSFCVELDFLPLLVRTMLMQ